MRRSVVSVVWVLVALAKAVTVQAADSSAAELVGGEGLLAIRPGPDESQPWRILRVGDRLPAVCQMRSAVGICRVKTPSAAVNLTSDARLRLDLPGRLLVLEQGSVLVKTTGKDAWACESEGVRAAIPADSVVELSAQAGQHVVLGVFEGAIEARVPGRPQPERIGAKTLWSWQTADKRTRSAPLSTQDQKRLAAWATMKKTTQGVGQLTVKDAQSESPVRLSVAQYRAHLVLHPPVALVQIDQSFFNPASQQAEGTFVFNLPKGASVSRFAMYVTPRTLIEGELIERKKAGNIYDAIVHRRRDPAILEQIDENLFKMRVFPIPGHDFKRILLDFTLPLEGDRGEFSFDLPLFTDREPIWDFQVTGAIRGPTRLESVASPSHPKLKFDRRGPEEVVFDWRESEFRPTGDLSLSFVQPEGEGPRLQSYTAPPLLSTSRDAPREPLADRAVTYFSATLPPEAAPAIPRQPADVVVLVETSASVKNHRLARHAARMVLQNLPPDCRLRVAEADVSCRWLTDGWTTPDSPQARKALQQLDQGVFLGKFQLNDALQEALTAFEAKKSPRRRIVVFVGSGKSPLDRSSYTLPTEEFAGRFRSLDVVPYAALVEPDNDTELARFASVVAASGGAVFQATRRNDRREMFDWLLAGLARPRQIVRVEVAGADREDLFYPTAWFPGRPWSVMGRTPILQSVNLDLTIHEDGKPVERRYELKAAPGQDDVFLGRLWAQRKLERLYPKARSRPEENAPFATPASQAADDPIGRQILAIAQEWSLLTPYTAFLVLESERDYRQWNVDRSLRRRYWKPAEALAHETPQGDVYSAHRARLAAAALARQKAAEAKQFDQALRSAREASTAGNDRLAQAILAAAGRSSAAAQSAEYADLKRQADAQVHRDALLEAFGPHRWLFMPPERPQPDRYQPSIAPLLAGPANADFERWHPYADRLLKEVRVEPETMTLERLVALLADQTGLNVVPDLRALKKAGIPFEPEMAQLSWSSKSSSTKKAVKRAAADDADPFADLTDPRKTRPAQETHRDGVVVPQEAARRNLAQEIQRSADETLYRHTKPEPGRDFVGWGRMSLRSYAKFVLAQKGLVLVEETHRLLITTPEQEANHLKTRIYPVASLLLAGEAVDPASLGDPYLDREQASGDRLRKKLARPTSIKYEDRPLEDVLRDVARLLDDNVLVDTKALDVVGMSLDKPVRAKWRDVPIRESLRWILGREGLTYTIEHESVVITTPDEAANRLEMRLHSGRGIVLQPSPRELERLRARGESLGPAGGRGDRGPVMGAMGAGMWGMGGMGGMGMVGGEVREVGGTFGGGMGGGMSRGTGGGHFAGSVAAAERFSSGGDDRAKPELDPEITPEDEDQPEPVFERSSPRIASGQQRRSEGIGVLPITAGGPSTAQRALDVDSVLDLVTSTIEPTTWDEVGGPGSGGFFEPTLDFIFSATEEVHEQIEALFDGLRRLPVPGGERRAYVPAEISREPGEVGDVDYNALIDTITSNIQPTSWDAVGGAGSIAPDEPHVALVVSQTQDVHDAVAGLLTLLGRRRFEALYGSRPWESLETGACPRLGGWAPKPRWIAANPAKLPDPRPEALRALAVRREPAVGQEAWRRKLPGGSELNSVVLGQAGARLPLTLSVTLPGRHVAVSGGDAAIRSPELLLTERGPWGEAVREWLDGILPWMPHRSNAELARRFDVRPVPLRADENASKVARLRFSLPACADPGRAYFEVLFSREDGLPRTWESIFDGRLTQRLRFERSEAGRPGRLQKVVLEDATGRAILCWVAFAGSGPIPPVVAEDREAEGYVCLDGRTAEPKRDAAFSRALNALRKRDWPSAAQELQTTLQAHPRHPLALVLLAWCWERHPGTAPRDAYLAWLRDAAASPANGAVRFIAQGHFPSLRAAELYEIAACQSASSRTGGDLEQLARIALEAGRAQNALEHIEASLKAAEGPHEQWRRERLELDILLRLGRREQVSQKALGMCSRPATLPSDMADVAAFLAKHELWEPADRLFEKALASKDLSASSRQELLLRRAAVQRGLVRWRSLLAAATASPGIPSDRGTEVDQVLGELTEPGDAQAAAVLAAETKDVRIRNRLLVRQAELAIDAKLASDLAWQVHQAGGLPAERIAWACRLWNADGQPGRTIDVLESRLRRGKALGQRELSELAAAYRHSNRPTDARRAETTPAELAPRNPNLQEPPSMGGGMGMF